MIIITNSMTCLSCFVSYTKISKGAKTIFNIKKKWKSATVLKPNKGFVRAIYSFVCLNLENSLRNQSLFRILFLSLFKILSFCVYHCELHLPLTDSRKARYSIPLRTVLIWRTLLNISHKINTSFLYIFSGINKDNES